jgi:membrane-bound serine protease (ClpP class)
MLLVAAILLIAFGVVEGTWAVVVLIGAALIEVGETGFWLWYTRRRRARVGAETLPGSRAVVSSACRPDGQVRLNGELWQARCEAGADVGARVVVRGLEGLTLLVEPDVPAD